MVILGGWVFLMSEVPLYTGLFPQNEQPAHLLLETCLSSFIDDDLASCFGVEGLESLQGCLTDSERCQTLHIAALWYLLNPRALTSNERPRHGQFSPRNSLTCKFAGQDLGT